MSKQVRQRDRVIIRSTIDLARHLGLRSTAEGVENADAQRWLRQAGCNQGQGFHIAPPMTPGVIDSLPRKIST